MIDESSKRGTVRIVVISAIWKPTLHAGLHSFSLIDFTNFRHVQTGFHHQLTEVMEIDLTTNGYAGFQVLPPLK